MLTTHCKRGHRLTPENTYTPPGTKHRRCKTCHRVGRRKGVELTPVPRGPAPVPITDRLWPFITIGGEDDCWPWLGWVDKRGGHGSINTGKQGKSVLVHRLAWMLCVGDPGDLYVLHRCDNPPCCNPGHLFLGTQADNIADMDAKGRCRRGGRGRLFTPEQEAEILSSMDSSRVVALRLGFPESSSAIRKLRRRGGYLPIPGDLDPFDTSPV